VPESARDDELWDAIGFFRALLARVDSSLVEEWEERMRPGDRASPLDPSGRGPDRPAAPQPYDLARHPRALAARVRGELHLLVRALAERDWEAAAASVRPDPDDPRTVLTALDERGIFLLCAVPTRSEVRVQVDEGEGLEIHRVQVPSGAPVVVVTLSRRKVRAP